MSDSVPIARTPPADFPCSLCGYNLRGLDPAGRCPECSQPIARSNHGDRLAVADPAWLRKLRLGTSLRLWSVVLTIFISMIGGVVIGAIRGPSSITMLASWLGAILGIWASFCITAQEPRTSLTEDPLTLRKSIRLCAILAFVNGILHAFEDSLVPSTGPAEIAYTTLNIITAIAVIFVYVAELTYFRRFALRVPDVVLARSTRILTWCLGMSWGLTIVCGLIFVNASATIAASSRTGITTTMTTPAGVTTTTNSPLITGVFAFGGCFFLAIAAFFFFWYVALLARYRRLFGWALARAPDLSSPSNG